MIEAVYRFKSFPNFRELQGGAFRVLDRESFDGAETKLFDYAVIDRLPDAKSNGAS